MPEVTKRRIRYKKDPWRQGQKTRTAKTLLRDLRRMLGAPPPYRVKFGREGTFGTDTVSVLRNRVRRKLQAIWSVALLLALLIGVLCGASLFWRVTDIKCEGTPTYDGEQIISQCGIRRGDTMLGFDRAAVEATLQAGDCCPLLARVDVKRGLDGTLTLTAREETSLFYTRHYVNYYLISGETKRVLCVDATPDAWRAMKPVYLGLPEEARIRVREVITYAYLPYPGEGAGDEVSTYKIDRGTAEETFAYVDEVLEAVMQSPFGPRVTGLELSDKYDLWFAVDDRIMIKLGQADELDLKLATAGDILARSSVTLSAVLDVSVPEKAGIREVADAELPPWMAH